MRYFQFQWRFLENLPDSNGKNKLEVVYPVSLLSTIITFNSGINSDHYGTGNSSINIFDYNLQKCYIYNDCAQESFRVNAFITIIGV